MPIFLDDFACLMNVKKESMREKFFNGKLNFLDETFRRYFESIWIPIRVEEFSVNPSDLDILAVDSSVYINMLSNGGIFYIARSLAVQRDIVGKKLETNVVFSRDRVSRIREFITVKMEMLEFEAALEALKNGFDGDAVLLDGSLYGRVCHIPIEYRVEEEYDVLLRYFRVYRELLNVCYRSNIPLVGVSKESRSTFYRDYLLSLIFNEKLKELNIEEDKKILEKLFFQVLDVEKTAFKIFSRLQGKYGDKLGVIDLILRELSSSRPDYQLIMSYASSIGYTNPLLLGSHIRMARRLKEYYKNPEECVGKYFPRLTMEKGEEFIQWASSILKSILEFPSFISFYILLDPRDSPIRIDTPYYGKSIFEISWPEPASIDVSDLLRIMVTGYCGLNAYNLWLRNADEKVRLKRRVVDNIYIPYLEKLFGEKIIYGRRYRRVKYP
ncbi:MAG: DNA double-strand break repair nuclease NurA [Candidatus Methanomethylicia archaeon]